MKKLITLTLLLCTLTLFLSSCGSQSAIPKPEDTNLECWLFDKPDEEKLTLIKSEYSYKRYLGSGSEHLDGNIGYVSNCVYYETTRASIGMMNKNRINHITITDPEITLWGLTINSTHDEVCAVLSQLGFGEQSWDEEFTFSLFKFQDSKRIYTIEVRYGSSIQIYCRNRDYVDEFLEKTGVFEWLTKVYIWLEEDVF
jgi:hypothetical protein